MQDMKYRVVIVPMAKYDLREHGDLIAKDSRLHALKWLQEANRLIFSLQEMPHRFAAIAESDEIGADLRDVVHYSHRIIYRINEREQMVEVLRVWHQARRGLQPSDLN